MRGFSSLITSSTLAMSPKVCAFPFSVVETRLEKHHGPGANLAARKVGSRELPKTQLALIAANLDTTVRIARKARNVLRAARRDTARWIVPRIEVPDEPCLCGARPIRCRYRT